jgi:oxalate decarboxylase
VIAAGFKSTLEPLICENIESKTSDDRTKLLVVETWTMTYVLGMSLLASRRQLFKGIVGVGAATALTAGEPISAVAAGTGSTAAPHAVSSDVDWRGKESVNVGDRPLEPGEVGRLAALDPGQGAVVAELPLLTGVIINIQRLAPGAAREAHWHLNRTELNCVIEGTGEMGIIGLDGKLTRIAIKPGTVTCVPQNLMHYMANTGSTELVVAMGFSSTKGGSSALSNALKAFGGDRLAQMTGLAPSDFTLSAQKESFIYVPISKLPPIDGGSALLVDGAVSSADFSTVSGFENDYGTAKDINSKVIGNLDGLSMSYMTLEPGALRDMHWHPHGTELVYIVDGELEWGLQAPGKSGDSSVFTAGRGDAVAVPEGWLHYAANTGKQTAKLLVLWGSALPQTIDLTGSLAALPLELTLASAGTMLEAEKVKSMVGRPSPFISPKL